MKLWSTRTRVSAKVATVALWNRWQHLAPTPERTCTVTVARAEQILEYYARCTELHTSTARGTTERDYRK